MREDPDTLLAHGSPLEECHLLIISLDRHGAEAPDASGELRERMPVLPVLLVAEAVEGGGTGAPLPDGFAVIRTPVQVEELRAAVRRLLPLRSGATVPARPAAGELAVPEPRYCAPDPV